MSNFFTRLFTKSTTIEKPIKTEKTVSAEETKTTNPIVLQQSSFSSHTIDYTKAETDGILEWEKRTGQRCEKLRTILKSKQNSDIKNHLDNHRDVIYLGEKIKENPELVTKIAKEYEGNAKEIIAVVKAAYSHPKYFKDIFKACPGLKGTDYQKIIKVYTEFDQRLTSVLSDYHKLLKLKKEIAYIQKNNGSQRELFEKFDKYKWLSPQHVKEQISRDMLLTKSIDDMPMMTVDDLVQKLVDVKNNQGRIDYFNEKFNNTRASHFDPYTLTYR